MPSIPSSLAAGDGVVLRAALARDGRILEEHRIRAGVLSVVMQEGAPIFAHGRRDALVSLDASARVLEGSVRGRLLGDGARAVAFHGGCALAPGDRGRVELNDGWGLLFELGSELPRARPRLPPALRRAPLLDGPFTAIALASLLLHAAFVLALEHMDPPYAASLVPDRTAELLMAIPSVPDAPPEAPLPTSNAPDPALSERGDAPRPTAVAESSPRRAPRPRPARPSPDAASLAEEVQRLVGAGLAGNERPFGAPVPSGRALLATEEGPVVAAGDAPRLARRTRGGTVTTEGLGALGDVVAEAGPRAEGRALEPTGPVGNVHVARDGIVCELPAPGVLEPSAVVRAVGRLRGAMTRCYERELASSPDLHGSVHVAFDIEESGEVTHVRAEEDTVGSAELSQCLVGVFRRMPRFSPGPTSGSVSFDFPLVFESADGRPGIGP